MLYLIHKEFIQFSSQKANTPVFKWTEDLSRYFPEEESDNQQVHEKMVNIINYQGEDANQNYNEISQYICQNGYYHKVKKWRTVARLWRKGNICAFLVSNITTMESSMEFLQKLKLELPYDPAILLLNIYLREMETLTWKDMHTPTFIAALL